MKTLEQARSILATWCKTCPKDELGCTPEEQVKHLKMILEGDTFVYYKQYKTGWILPMDMGGL